MMRERWILGGVLIAAGCATPPQWKFWEAEPTHEEIAIQGKSWERVFEVASEVLQEEGNVEESDLTAGTIRTAWDVHPHPFPGEGRRERFEVRLVRDEASDGILIHCVHRLERNANEKDVMNLSKAHWVPVSAEPSRVRAICWRIAYRLEVRGDPAAAVRAAS